MLVYLKSVSKMCPFAWYMQYTKHEYTRVIQLVRFLYNGMTHIRIAR